MRAEVLPRADMPGRAVLRVHDLRAMPDGLTICIERRQGPEKYLAEGGWQRSEAWLAPERVEAFANGIDFHVGPVVCDMVAGLTVRLSIKEPGVGNIGATVVPWPTMQTSGAYDENRMVTDDTPMGTDRGFGTGSAPTTVVRLPEAPQPVESPPTQVNFPQPFQVAESLPQQFQPAPEMPPSFPMPPPEPQMPGAFPFGPPPDQPMAPAFPFGGPPPMFDDGQATVIGQRPMMPMDRFEPEVEEPKKSRTGLWVTISVMMVLLLVGAGGGAFWWFEPCGFCDISKQVGVEICDRCGPKEPERVTAARFLGTSPAPAAMVEKCREFRGQGLKIASFLVCRAAAEGGDPVGAAEYASYFDPVNRAPYSAVEPDAGQAVEWYEKAAKVDLVLAMRRLGQLYAKGADNFPADKAKAREWLAKAADKGDAEAKKALEELQ